MGDKSKAVQALLEDRRKGFQKDSSLPLAQKIEKGIGYQVKTAALIVISALKKNGISYNLSTEDTSAKAFDDLVFKYTGVQEDQYVCRFLQLKHRERGSKITFNELFAPQMKKKDSAFHLIKYFKAFLDIRKQEDYNNKKCIVEKCIIYTPAELDFDDGDAECCTRTMTSESNTVKFRELLEKDEFLNVGQNSSMYQLQVNNFIRKLLLRVSGEQNVTAEEIIDFLEHLVFAVGQPTVHEMDDILLDKLKEASIGIDSKVFREALCNHIQAWFRNTKSPKHFTESETVNCALQVLSDIFDKSVALSNVTFSPNNKLDNFLDGSDRVLWISTSSLKLSTRRLIQQQVSVSHKYVLNFKDLLTVSNIVIPYSPLENTILSIVLTDDCIYNSIDSREVLASLVDKFLPCNQDGGNVSKLIIITSSIDQVLEETLKENVGECLCEEVFDLSSLSDESRCSLLKKNVLFQGFPICLEKLCDQNSLPSFNTKDVEILSSEEEIIIDSHATKLKDNLEPYIPRDLYIENILHMECLIYLRDQFVVSRPDNRNCFAPVKESSFFVTYSVTLIDDLCGNSPNVFILDAEDANEKYQSLCSSSKGNIHRLQLLKIRPSEVVLAWLETRGSSQALQPFLNKSCQLEALDVQENPTTVIVADSGMGKTTLLSHWAKERKAVSPNKWIIRVNLRETAQELIKINLDCDSTIFSLKLSNVLQKEDSISRMLLQHCLVTTGNFIMLLDGYDELSLQEREKVCRILMKIKSNFLGQIVITSRSHFKDELERTLSSIAYHLLPFSRNEQQTYLEQYWIRNLSLDEIESERATTYAAEVVKNVTTNFDPCVSNMLAIPLHINLLAKVYEEKCKKYCDLNVLSHKDLLEVPSIFMLFEKYETKRYSSFMQNQITWDRYFLDQVYHLLRDEHRNICAKIAIEEMFPSLGFSCDCMKGQEKGPWSVMQSHILRIGILQKLESGKITFVHRNIAEYFLALHLADNIGKCQFCSKCIKVMKRIFYNDHFLLIRSFIDTSLALSKIHIAAASNDVVTLERELSTRKNIDQCDVLGRTACHIAAAHGQIEALKFLLDKRCKVREKDFLLRLTPVEIAVKLRKWEICSLFLRAGVKLKLTKRQNFQLFWHLCMKGELESLRALFNLHFRSSNEVSLIKLLLSKDPLGRTALDVAAESGEADFVELILDTYENCCMGDAVDIMLQSLERAVMVSKCRELTPQYNSCLTIIFNKAWENNAVSIVELSKHSPLSCNQGVLTTLIRNLDKHRIDETVLMVVLYGNKDDLEHLSHKIGEITGDVVTYVKQKFYSFETVVHFAANFTRGCLALMFFLDLLVCKEQDILPLIYPEDNVKMSLLHLAVKACSLDLLKFYVSTIKSKGKSVFRYLCCKDYWQRTPLHYAVQLQRPEIVEYLLNEIKMEGSFTVQRQNIDWGMENDFLEVFFEEIESSGNNVLWYILQRDYSQRTCYHFLMEMDTLHHTCISRNPDEIDHPCSAKWLNKYMKEEVTRIFETLSMMNKEDRFMEFLLSKLLEIKDTYCYLIFTILDVAVSCGQTKICELLIQKLVNNTENSPHCIIQHVFKFGLERITIKLDKPLLEYMLETIQDKGECIPEIIYTLSEFQYKVDLLSCVKYLMNSLPMHGKISSLINPFSLHFRGFIGDADFVKLYIQRIKDLKENVRFPISSKDHKGKMPIHYAAENGSIQLVIFFLSEFEKEYGNPSPCFYPNEHGWTLLQSSTISGNKSLVQFVLDKITECEFNILHYILQESNGLSAIHCASSRGHFDVVLLLLNTIKRETPILLPYILSHHKYKTCLINDAALHGSIELLEFLLQNTNGMLLKSNRYKKKRKKNLIISTRYIHIAWLKSEFKRMLCKKGKRKRKKKHILIKLKKFERRGQSSKKLQRTFIRRCNVTNYMLLKDKTLKTPLHHATINDRDEVLEFMFAQLVESRSLRKCENGGRTVFHYSVLNRAQKCLQVLLEKVRHTNGKFSKYLYMKDCDGKTPIDYSLVTGCPNLARMILEVLLEKENNTFAYIVWLCKILESFPRCILKRENIEVFQYLFQRIMKENTGRRYFFLKKDETLLPLLFTFAKYSDPEVFSVFMKECEKQKRDILHCCDKHGKTILDEALFHENFHLAEYLIHEIERRGKNKESYFSERDFKHRNGMYNVEESKILSTSDETLQNISKVQYHFYIIKPLNKAITTGCKEIVKLLLKVADEMKLQCIINSYKNNDVHSNPVFKYMDILCDGETLLQRAVKGGNSEIFQIILSKVKEEEENILQIISVKDANGRTVVHTAASVEMYFIKFLLQEISQCKGNVMSYIWQEDNFQRTPLHYAVEHGCFETVKYLLEEMKTQNIPQIVQKTCCKPEVRVRVEFSFEG